MVANVAVAVFVLLCIWAVVGGHTDRLGSSLGDALFDLWERKRRRPHG